MDGVDATSLLVIVGAAAIAGVFVALVSPRLVIPVVVVELLLGIVIGPQVADIAKLDATTELFSDLGLGMLFFFAGYEIDLERIRGAPLKLAGIGWALSLALAYGIGGVLAAAGVVLSFLYTGSAMATTAIGTLIPILRDAGELRDALRHLPARRGRRRRVRADPAGDAGALDDAPAARGRRSWSLFIALAVVTGGAGGALDAPWLVAAGAQHGDEQPAGDPARRGARLRRWWRWRPSSASTFSSAASSPG